MEVLFDPGFLIDISPTIPPVRVLGGDRGIIVLVIPDDSLLRSTLSRLRLPDARSFITSLPERTSRPELKLPNWSTLLANLPGLENPYRRTHTPSFLSSLRKKISFALSRSCSSEVFRSPPFVSRTRLTAVSSWPSVLRQLHGNI